MSVTHRPERTHGADRPPEARRDRRAEAPPDRGWTPVLGVPLGITLLLAVLVSAFAWPAVNSAPRGVGLAIAAPVPAAEQVESQLAAHAGADAFDVTVVADRAAAEDAVRNRDVYGALVLGPQGGEALVASAASPAVAQIVTELASGIPAEAGGPLAVTDVVPLPDEDPRGLGLAAGLLPLVVGGIALGAATALRVRGGVTARLTALTGGAVLGGLTVVGLLQGWLGALGGSFWANAGVAALLILAIAATVAGLGRLLGAGGIALGALLMVVLGNPLSGVTSAPEMLPSGWGTLGQWLPPGAGGTALRSVAYFDAAGSGTAWLVLSGWVLLGLVLLALPASGRRSVATVA